MPQIIVSPEELSSVGAQLRQKTDEVELLIAQANSVTEAMLSNWRGNRAGKFSGDWLRMRSDLNSAIQVLHQASELLSRAAQDFQNADRAA